MISSIFTHIEANDFEEVKKLIEYDIKCLIERDEEYMTPLHVACKYGSESIVKFIIQTGNRFEEANTGTSIVDVNVLDKNHWTPLHWACYRKHFKICEYLLRETFCIVNCCDLKLYHTPLHFLSSVIDTSEPERFIEVLTLLYTNGIDLNAENKNLETPIYMSCLHGSEIISSWLLSYRVLVNYKNINGESVLHAAVRSGKFNIVQNLLQFGAYITLNNEGLSPIDIALKKSFDEIYLLLTTFDFSKTKINFEIEQSPPPSDWFVLNRSQSMIRHVDEIGNPWKRTNLHQAVISCNEEEVKTILKISLENLNIKDQPKGWSPILYAAAYGYLSIAKILVEHQCDVDITDLEGSTMLHLISRNKNNDEEMLGELLSLLVSRKMDLNVRNTCGYTALHEAAIRNNFMVIKLLVCAGANVDELSNENDSALIFAVQEGYVESVNMLLHYGALKDFKGKNGTALDVARRSNSIDIIKVLIFDEDELNQINNVLHDLENDILPSKNMKHNQLYIENKKRRTKELSRRQSMDSLNIPLNVIVDNVTANSIASHSQKNQSPLASFRCVCSQSIKSSEKDQDGILSIWRDRICFVSLKDNEFAFTINISSITSIEWDIFIIWSKLNILCEDMKIVISKCDNLVACKNILDFLFNQKLSSDETLLIHGRPFEESIGSILYPKENSDMHRYPGLPISESIIAHCVANFKQAGRFAHKTIYITKKRIIFGKNNLIGILFEEMKSIKKIPDKGIVVETTKKSYFFTRIDRRDYIFNILEYLWNNKQSDNRIMVISSKTRCAEELAISYLKQIETQEDVYARWIRIKGYHYMRNNEEFFIKKEGNVDLVWTTTKDILTPLLQMRKLVVFYLEEDPKLVEYILEVIKLCKNEKHFKYFVLITFDTVESSLSYLQSIQAMKASLQSSDIRYTHIISTPSLMQWFLMDNVNVKRDWKIKFPLNDQKIAWLDQRDLLDTVFEISLTNREMHHSKIYFLTGPEELSCTDICKLISSTTKQVVLFSSISMEDMKKSLYDTYLPPFQYKQNDNILKISSGGEGSSPISRKASFSQKNGENIEEIEIQMNHFKYLSENESPKMFTTLDIIGSTPRTFMDFLFENLDRFKVDSISKFNFYQHEALTSQFNEICEPITQILDANRFEKTIGTVLTNTNSPLLGRLFKIFDRENSGRITQADYFSIIEMMIIGTIDEQFRISTLFIDADEDKLISLSELRKTNDMIVKLFQRFNLTHSASVIEEFLSPDYLDGFIEDKNGQYKAYLSFEEFFKVYKNNYTKLFSLQSLFPNVKIDSNVCNVQKDINILNGHPQWDLSIVVAIGMSKLHNIIKTQKEEDEKRSYTDETSVMIPCKALDESWTFTSYATNVFRQIREIYDISNDQYIFSLGFERLIVHLVLGKLTTFYAISSSGRSGSFIWLSFDRKFLIKSIPVEEFQLLRRHLQRFHEHYKNNENTLISRIYGLYKVTSPKGETTYLVVMSYLFDTFEIHEQYDLKGSTHNRSVGYKDWTPSKALKDMDFHHRIILDPDKKAFFLYQMEKDVTFLEKMNICDYSLLVGFHYKDTLTNDTPLLKDRSLFKKDMGGIERSQVESIPKVKIIYYIGLIDVLTEYNLKKKGERAWKSIVHQGQISAISPNKYRKRFMRYLCTIFD